MKKQLILLFIIVSNLAFGQNKHKKIDPDKTVINIPSDLFDGMFRMPDDKYLIAWHGVVKVASVTVDNGDKDSEVSILPFVSQLNTGYNQIFRAYFKRNMKDGKKQIVSKKETVWAARCGLKSKNNINISPISGEDIGGFSADITSDVWSKTFTFKRSYTNTETNRKVNVTYKIEATSIYFYHLKKTDLDGEFKRSDNFNECAEIKFLRIGPGINGSLNEKAKIENGKYKFEKQLTRGDYKVSLVWPHGDELILDEDFVYNPTARNMVPNFKLETFQGKIEGKVISKKTELPLKDYKVMLKPYCVDSDLPELETKTNENGKYVFEDVYQGEYKIVVKGSKDVDAFLTKDKKITPHNSEVRDGKYDIYATYNAPGFVKVKLVWRNVTIRFLDEGEEMQIFDPRESYKSGATGHPVGTKGKPLAIPFTTITPYANETYYGFPEDENSTPEIIKITNLGGKSVFADFRVKRDGESFDYRSKDEVYDEDNDGSNEGALNSCNISQINKGPIYLDIGFDLTGRYVKSDEWAQISVYSADRAEWSMTKGHTPNGYPQAFKRHIFSPSEIEKLRNFEEFDINLSRNGATMKVEFKLSEEKKEVDDFDDW